jgi:hypothetical protein
MCQSGDKMLLSALYQVALRGKRYRSIEYLQAGPDVWVRDYNVVRIHPGRWCHGETPMQAFIDMLPVAKEKLPRAM